MVLANDSDADGDPLTASLVSGAAHGGVVLNTDGTFTYTANSGYSGAEAFTYRVSDGVDVSNIATVTPVNDVPVVVDLDRH